MKRILPLLLSFYICLSALAQVNTNRLLDNGRNALYFDDYVLAIQYFNQIIIVKPQLAEPYFYRAVAKIQLEDYIGAESDCNEALERNPFMHAAFYARGFARKRLEKYEEAKQDLSNALEFSPENEQYLINRIEVFEKLKEFDKAMNDIQLLQSKKTDIANLLWLEKGSIFLQQGDTLKALEAFNTALAKDTTNAEFWGARAYIKLQKNDNTGALSDYDKAIFYKSKNIGHYINRGILNYRERNYKGAISDYEKAVELDSTNIQALFNRGLLRSEVGDINNAIADYTRILQLDEKNDEARFQRASNSLFLKDYTQAKIDYNSIIQKYPYFVPAYFGRADAYAGLGNLKQAAIDRYKGQQLMADKEKIQKKESEINTKAQIAQTRPSIAEKAKEFDNVSETNNKYEDKIRGAIQNNYAQLQSKKNYVLTYYSPNDNLRNINNFNLLLENYNQVAKSNIVLSNDEAPLTQELIEYHFKRIPYWTDKISAQATNGKAFFERGINYALIQNLEAAVEDFNQAIHLENNLALAYFCRANVLYKMLDYSLNNQKTKEQEKNKGKESPENLNPIKLSQIINDYNKVLELQPDFTFAWFNRGNSYLLVKNYKNAIVDYTEALKINRNFAEAYFNRGICYILNNEKDKGLSDLSKAGELGIYQAYNLLKRFQE